MPKLMSWLWIASRYAAWFGVRARRSPRRDLVQRLQHFQRLLRARLRAVDLELLVPVGDADFKRGLDRAQVAVHGPAKVVEPGVVGRRKGVANDHDRYCPRFVGTLCRQTFKGW